MGRKYLPIGLFLAAIAGWLSACLEPASYPDEPVITFKALNKKANGADLVIGFTDGDGDIGLDQSDTTGINCPDTCIYHYNLFCEYYELRDGEWTHIEIDFQESVPFYYRIPRINPSGQNPALNGEIIIDMGVYYLPSLYDTFRFEIQMVDRALNMSNIVTTDTFVKD